MLRRLLMGLLVAGLGGAQSLVTVRAGALQCGAVRRAADGVQTYCFDSTGKVVLHNAIDIISPLGVVLSYNYGTDIITWKFRLAQPDILYDVVANGGATQQGKLTSIYGAAVIRDLGFLTASGCKPNMPGFIIVGSSVISLPFKHCIL